LVRWILDVTKSGYPPDKTQIREMAEQIRRRHVSKINDASIILVEYPPLGRQWVDRFIQRHESLRAEYARCIDASRMKEKTADTIMRWLNTVRETMEKFDVDAENIYNMDESSFAIGTTQGTCVVIDSRIRSQFQARPGRQE
jgi:Tc5 transposase DNA-binding domain